MYFLTLETTMKNTGISINIACIAAVIVGQGSFLSDDQISVGELPVNYIKLVRLRPPADVRRAAGELH